jgi:hypothetical protein
VDKDFWEFSVPNVYVVVSGVSEFEFEGRLDLDGLFVFEVGSADDVVNLDC